MDRDVAEGIEGQGNGWEGGGNNDDGEGEARDVRGAKRYGFGVGQLDEGRGPRPVGVHGGEACGGRDMVGGCTDSQGEKGLPGNWTCGGDVEGSGGDFKYPAHSLHHLPRLPPLVPGSLRDRYRHPRVQAD